MSASYKDTFEAQSFWAWSFKCGTFRGSSVSAAVSGPYRVAQAHGQVAGARLGAANVPGAKQGIGYVAGAQMAKAIT